MKHEHVLEVKVPEQVENIRNHIEENKSVYLFFGGIVVGVVGTRIFSRPTVTQTIVVHTGSSAVVDG